MILKAQEQKIAIKLRKEGATYNDILRHVRVSKSTLSLWLREIELGELARSKIKLRLTIAQKSGGTAKHKKRVEKSQRINEQAVAEIKDITSQELFLMGVMLYWAEGTKQRKDISHRVEFTNSDPNMCRFFLKWLRECVKVSIDDIVLCIYIHESKSNLQAEAMKYWSEQTHFPAERFGRTCITRTVYPRKNKRINLIDYYGQLRIRVRKSTDLNRKIAGWTNGVCIKSGVVASNVL
jgi:hypothetical protein